MGAYKGRCYSALCSLLSRRTILNISLAGGGAHSILSHGRERGRRLRTPLEGNGTVPYQT